MSGIPFAKELSGLIAEGRAQIHPNTGRPNRLLANGFIVCGFDDPMG
jgi:hypothetical protein